MRLTLFGERANNAIISQTNLATNPNTGAQVPTTTIGNVAAIRMQDLLRRDREQLHQVQAPD
jgi:iron complex outermembrane receptor protein